MLQTGNNQRRLTNDVIHELAAYLGSSCQTVSSRKSNYAFAWDHTTGGHRYSTVSDCFYFFSL